MTFTPELLERLANLFVGRTDVYGLGKVDPATNKARYIKVSEPVDIGLWQQHTEGTKLVGVYPLVDTKVKWFAVDIDAPKVVAPDDAGDSWEPPTAEELQAQVWQDALRQYRVFASAGLHVYLERSRSGAGMHIWGFLSEWTEASVVRRALKPLCITSDTYDRMYPVQDDATGKNPYGNLIALPYNGTAYAAGNSTFVTPEGEILPPDVFVSKVLPNSPSVIKLLADKAPKETQRLAKLERARAAGPSATIEVGAGEGRPATPLRHGFLTLLSSYGCQFMRTVYQQRANPAVVKDPEWYAALGQLTVFENGRDMAHIISQGHPAYDPRETDAKYDHAMDNPPVGCAFIHDNFPRLACKGCPMKAPYHQAKKELKDINATDSGQLQRGGFGRYLPRIWERDAGHELPGIDFGLGELARWTRLRRGELVVVGAQVSMGKTSSMVHQSHHVAALGFVARVFSAEMGEEGLLERYLAHRADVDSRKLMGEARERLTADERRRIEEEARKLDNMPLEFNYTAATPQSILHHIERSVVRQRQALETPYAVFFDYLQFAAKLKGDLDTRDKTSRTVKQLKVMAKLLEQPVVTYSQLQRQAEGDDEPRVTWFKESGDIEAEMDVGIIWTGQRLEGRRVPRSATIVKQRRGHANVRADFMLDQATSMYEPVVRRPLDENRPPLFELSDVGREEGE